jgi:prepilin-type N-terminal cleavage/methylation domain-containing protein
MRHHKKAFTLVEMLVALSVSAIIVAATYASFELIQKQYKKNMDVIEMHGSGRAIIQILERELRMAGYEFRDGSALMTYGTITAPIEITDSGNQCCDEVTIIYDEVFDTLNSAGFVTSSTVERIQTRFWTEAFPVAGTNRTSRRGNRFRLFKQRTILGQNNALIVNPRAGAIEVMADYVEDLQLSNTSGFANLYATDTNSLHVYDTIVREFVRTIPLPHNTYANGSIDIDRDGLVYIPVIRNNLTSILILNPTTTPITTNFIDPPAGGGNRFTPDVGVGFDGNLYIGVTGGLADVYDRTTLQIIRSGITPNQAIDNLIANETDSNSIGLVCNPVTNTIQCVRNSTVVANLTGANTGYRTLSFGSDTILYAGNRTSPRMTIDIFNTTSQQLIGRIGVGDPGQINTARTFGLVSASTIQTLSTVDISLTLRSKETYGQNRGFNKRSYHPGNFNFQNNDQYFRDTFSSTVSLRNL